MTDVSTSRIPAAGPVVGYRDGRVTVGIRAAGESVQDVVAVSNGDVTGIRFRRNIAVKVVAVPRCANCVSPGVRGGTGSSRGFGIA